MKATWTRLLLATAAVALACGGSDPEAELVEASQAVEEARTEVETARDTVQEREAEVEDARKRLTEARAALREAQEKVAKREETVDRNATDAVLFRTVQKHLLEHKDLKDVAISASVTKGVVTLSGSVPDAKVRDRAVELARETPGVADVKSRIDVPVSAPKQPGG